MTYTKYLKSGSSEGVLSVLEISPMGTSDHY